MAASSIPKRRMPFKNTSSRSWSIRVFPGLTSRSSAPSSCRAAASVYRASVKNTAPVRVTRAVASAPGVKKPEA